MQLRLLLGFTAPNGAFRVTRFAHDIPVVPAITCGAVSVAPMRNTLRGWNASVPVAAATAFTAHKALHGTFDVLACSIRSTYWQLVSPSGGRHSSGGGGEAEAGAAGAIARLQRVLQVEGHRKRVAEVQLEPVAEPPAEDSAVQWEAALNDCALLLHWRLRIGSNVVPRVGVLRVPPVPMAKLLTASALRLQATILDASASAVHACTLAAAHGGATHTDVLVRVRNCGSRPISLCFECGELGPDAGPAAPATPSQGGASERLFGEHLKMNSRARHQWLGGGRRHVMELAAQGEQSCRAQLALSGTGLFSIDSYMCTWNDPAADILGRVLPGERLEVFVADAGDMGS